MRGTATVLLALVACSSSGNDTGDGRDTDAPPDSTPDPGCDPTAGDGTVGVGVEGAGAFASIGLAVAAAPPGGTVHVCGGVWHEVVTIDKDLVLLGHDGPTIDAGGIGSAIDVASGTVRIEGFTITGGTGSTAGPRPTNGGGVNAYRATGPVEVVDCDIHGNLADLAGGVLFGDAGGSLVGSTVRDNVAGLYGGGVYTVGDLEVTGSEILDNLASANGGGLVVGEGALVVLSDAWFEGNHAEGGGGIFSFRDGRIEASDTTVVDNRATIGGGGVHLLAADLVGGTVEGNDGGELGGGVYAEEGGAIEKTVIRANLALSGAGLTLTGPVDLVGVVVEDNVASVRAGGVYALDADVVADDATVVRGNSAVQWGGGVWMRGSSWSGGTIAENGAEEGAGFYLTLDGTVSNIVSDATITDNTAGLSGGGLFAGSPFTATGLTLLRNLALERGGGLYTTTDAVGSVNGSTLSSNSAVQRGGGIYANNGSTITVSGTTIDRNLALRGAGIYLNASSTVTLIDSAVEANGDATTVSGGGARVTSGQLVSIGSDWGAGESDNVPDDTYVEGPPPVGYLGYEGDEGFSCDENACALPP